MACWATRHCKDPRPASSTCARQQSISVHGPATAHVSFIPHVTHVPRQPTHPPEELSHQGHVTQAVCARGEGSRSVGHESIKRDLGCTARHGRCHAQSLPLPPVLPFPTSPLRASPPARPYPWCRGRAACPRQWTARRGRTSTCLGWQSPAARHTASHARHWRRDPQRLTPRWGPLLLYPARLSPDEAGHPAAQQPNSQSPRPHAMRDHHAPYDAHRHDITSSRPAADAPAADAPAAHPRTTPLAAVAVPLSTPPTPLLRLPPRRQPATHHVHVAAHEAHYAAVVLAGILRGGGAGRWRGV